MSYGPGFEPMQRHRPMRMMPHDMFQNIFVDRPHRIDAESERMKVNLDDIKTSLAYKPTTTFEDGNVKALLIGINYTGTEYALNGCVNDVHTMLDTLREVDFPISESCILVDDESFPNVTATPTRENIIKYISWLVKDAESGDVLFLHYSGHGAQTKSQEDTQEEYDQCIIPLDYQTKGTIVDDDLFKMLAEPLPEGVRLTCVFDCCHSATMLDLPFVFESKDGVETKGGDDSRLMKKVRDDNFSKGDVIVFSGCEDSQTSADVQNTASFGGGSDSTGAGGAATQAITYALTKVKDLDFMNVLLQARDVLKEKGFAQVPQLSSSKPVDLDKPFSLFGTITANAAQMHRHVPEQFRRPPPPPHGRTRGGPCGGFGHGPMTQLRRAGGPMFTRGGRGGAFGSQDGSPSIMMMEGSDEAERRFRHGSPSMLGGGAGGEERGLSYGSPMMMGGGDGYGHGFGRGGDGMRREEPGFGPRGSRGGPMEPRGRGGF